MKIALIELQRLSEISDSNLKTNEGNYWNSLTELKYSLEYISNSTFSNKKKQSMNINYVKSLFFKKLSFDKLKFFSLNENADTMAINSNGYYGLDQNLMDRAKNKSIRKRYNRFQRDTSLINPRIKASLELESNSKKSKELNIVHLNKLMQLINISKEKDIQLIFVLPPRQNDYKELLSVLHHIPKENIIEIASFKKFPELYLAKNSFDIGHLNSSGSVLFTTYLAKKLEEILKDRKIKN